MTIIKNHKVTEADYVASPNVSSGTITPKFIVMHYTAGWTGESAIEVLSRKGSGVSAHFVVDEKARVTQLVPMNRKAWHAGPSRYAGYSGLNSHSIGIEIVNIGYLKKVGADRYMDHTGSVHTANKGRLANVDLIEAAHPRVGSGTYYWPAYSREQLDVVEELTRAIAAKYDILDVVSHEEIDTRGWKTDPGPAFPMERFKRLVQDRAAEQSRFMVTANSLNVRSGPGTDYAVIGSFNKGDNVDEFDRNGSWVRVSAEGWVHGAYLRLTR